MRYLLNLKGKLFSEIDSVPEILSKRYYPSLDGLRAFAILSVVLEHISVHTPWGVWVDGTIGIHIFFMISGFLITTLLIKERIQKGKVSLKNFYARRTLRIFPVAYLYIFVLIGLNYFYALHISFKSFLTALLYLKNFPVASDWYTGHFWSLAIEEQFYLIFPIILITNINNYIKILLLLFIAVPIVDYVGFHNIGIFYTNHIVHTITFIFITLFDLGTLYILSGSLFAILVFKDIINIDRFKNNYFLSTICLIVAAIIHFVYLVGSVPYLSSITFSILMGFVIVLNLYENNFLTSILSRPLIVKVGILSYSIYVWQQIFTLSQPWKGYFPYSDSIVFNIALLIIVAFCSYTFYEKRFLNLRSRFK